MMPISEILKRKTLAPSSTPARMVPVCYDPIPESCVAELEELIADIRSGKVTDFAWVSAGPEFTRFGGGYVNTPMGRMAIMAALGMKLRQVQDQEIERAGV